MQNLVADVRLIFASKVSCRVLSSCSFEDALISLNLTMNDSTDDLDCVKGFEPTEGEWILARRKSKRNAKIAKKEKGGMSSENDKGTEERGIEKEQKRTGKDKQRDSIDDNVFSIFGTRSRTPSTERPESVVCKRGPGKPRCGDPVMGEEHGIRCDKCLALYHSSCQLIPKAAVSAAGRFSMLHWFCTSCHESIFNPPDKNDCTKLTETLNSFEKGIIRKVKGQVESMAKTVSEHIKLVNRALRHQEEVTSEQTRLIEKSFIQQHEAKVSYAEMVKGSCAELAKEVSRKVDTLSNPQPDPPQDIYSAVNSVLDKERRKLNVVVSNLPESTPTEDETREKVDLRNFMDLIRDNLKLNIKATKCHRQGWNFGRFLVL